MRSVEQNRRVVCIRKVEQKVEQPEISDAYGKNAPKGIRIPVNGLKGRRPGPLDDGGADDDIEYILFGMLATSAAL